MMETTETTNPKAPLAGFARVGLILIVMLGSGLLLILFCWQQGRLASFSEPEERILYLGGEAGGAVSHLSIIRPDGSGQTQLTNEPLGVVDFALSPDDLKIVYSAPAQDGSVDLWQIGVNGRSRRQLLDCQAAICTQAAWAADGRRLIYERRPLSAEGQVIDAPQLWWLDSQTGETLTVFADEAQGGVAARLSPNGRYLSATLPDDQEIHVTDLESGAVLVIPSQTGEAAVWSPDSETLLVSDMQYQGEQFSIHLFRANVESGELTNLSGVDLQTSDGQPVFSPDGEWIAFTRKKTRAPMGKQLWLMRSDGSEPRALTEDAEWHYSNPTWSPDGSRLVVQVVSLTEPEALPALWQVDIEKGEWTELVSPGTQPVWLN